MEEGGARDLDSEIGGKARAWVNVYAVKLRVYLL